MKILHTGLFQKISTYNYFAAVSVFFAFPPTLMWLLVFWYRITGWAFFKAIIASVYLSGSIFPAFLIGFAYPGVGLIFGIVGYQNTKDGVQRGRTLSSITMVLSVSCIVVTLCVLLFS